MDDHNNSMIAIAWWTMALLMGGICPQTEFGLTKILALVVGGAILPAGGNMPYWGLCEAGTCAWTQFTLEYRCAGPTG